MVVVVVMVDGVVGGVVVVDVVVVVLVLSTLPFFSSGRRCGSRNEKLGPNDGITVVWCSWVHFSSRYKIRRLKNI